MKEVTASDFNQKRTAYKEEAVTITSNGKPDKILLSAKLYNQMMSIIDAYYLTSADYLEVEQKVHLDDLLKTLRGPDTYLPGLDPSQGLLD